jgi:hypothetical protein
MSIYNCREVGKNTYMMTKFDDDINVENSYHLRRVRGNYVTCDCFRSNKHTCRHREMLSEFVTKRAVNSGKFYDLDHKKWLPAIKL